MTVGDIRVALDGVPDETPVYVFKKGFGAVEGSDAFGSDYSEMENPEYPLSSTDKYVYLVQEYGEGYAVFID